MLYSIKNREDLEKLEEMAAKKHQVEEVRLQEKLGAENFHQNTKKLFEPVTNTIKVSSEILTKTTTETSIKNNKAKRI